MSNCLLPSASRFEHKHAPMLQHTITCLFVIRHPVMCTPLLCWHLPFMPAPNGTIVSPDKVKANTPSPFAGVQCHDDRRAAAGHLDQWRVRCWQDRECQDGHAVSGPSHGPGTGHHGSAKNSGSTRCQHSTCGRAGIHLLVASK